MQNLIRLFRDPNPNDTSLPPSLVELESGVGADGKPLIKPLPLDNPLPPKPGEAGYVEPKFGEEGYVLKPGDEGYELKPGDDGYEPKPGEEGYVPKEGEEGYVAPEAGTEPQFWDEVEKITGRKVEITYPDGIEADTPEGAAFREEFVREEAAIEFESKLAESSPRAYAFFLHMAAGKPENEFFGDTGASFSLPELSALEASVDLQTSMYKHDLISRGLDDDAAQTLVDKAIKDNKLKDLAVTAYKITDAAQKQQLADLQKEQAAEETKFNTSVQAISTRIATAIKEELSFVVPTAREEEFKTFVANHLQYDKGEFFLVQKVASDKDFKNQLESLFFQFVKGDLSTVVKKQVKTEAAQRLKLVVKKAEAGTGGGQRSGDDGTKNIPLGDH